MKKSVVYFLTGMLMLNLAACGSGDQGNSGAQNNSGTQNNSGAQDNSGTQGSSDAQNSSGSQGSGDVAGGNGETQDGWSEEMAGLKAAVVEALGDNYWPDMQLDAQMLESTFGIKAEMYEDYLAEMPMISNNIDTLVVVKAKADQVDAVESALNAYRDNQINNSFQYPMNLGKVQASYVEKSGNYVMFVQLGGDDMAAMDQGEAAAIAFCQEANQLVIDTIKQKLGQ